MRKLLYALAAMATVAPLAAFGTASAAPARPAPAPAPAVRPFNLPTGKCFKLTDADPGNYGSLYYNGSKIVTSHSHYTGWCPLHLSNGWQMLLTANKAMADHASGNYLTEYNISGGSPTCNLQSGINVTANDYCQWVEFLSSGVWTIESGNASLPNGEYITAVGSGSAVKLALFGTDDQDWTATCVTSC